MLVFTMSMTAYGRAGSFRSSGFHVSHSYTPRVRISTPKVTVPRTSTTKVTTPSSSNVKHTAVISNPVVKPVKSTESTKPTIDRHSNTNILPLPIIVNGKVIRDTQVLYETYGIDANLAQFYMSTKDCPQSDKDLWNKTLRQHFEKGKAPEKSEEVKQFEERLNVIKPAYQEHLKKQQEIQKQRSQKAKEAFTRGACGFTVSIIAALSVWFAMTKLFSTKR